MTKGNTTPKYGDRILIIKDEWLKPVLAKKKKMEIRGRAYAGGFYWLGYDGKIQGNATLGKAFRIEDEEAWEKHRSDHLVQSTILPYKKTWGLHILSVNTLPEAIPFKHPNGAIGLVLYRGV